MTEPDVLIVGAGPAGAVAALRLAQEGFRVTVLEQGDWPDYSKARVADPSFAVTADRDWGWDPNVRQAPGDYPIDDSESDITALMWNGVGGGTVVYAAQWQRNMPSDFRVRSLDGVADDWPFTYEDLEPYYVRVEKDFGISGLASSSGMVGKRLMMHPFGTVVGLFEDDLGSTQGPWGQHLHCLEFYETDTSRGFVRGAKWGLQPTGGPTKMTTAYPWGAENAIWGTGFHESVRKRLGHSAMWGIIAEDLPEEHNRVELDPVKTDRQGVPAAKIVYRMNQNSYDLMHFHEARAKESLEAAGAYETTIAPFIRATGWHLLGTCKMGDDPATSVVDGFGRTHDIANLFIFDGSTWPTSSGMNPTATIAAMALRSVEHLIESRRTMAVAA